MTTEPRTLLKYAIEVALPRTTRLLGVLEPFLERVVYEVRASTVCSTGLGNTHHRRFVRRLHGPP